MVVFLFIGKATNVTFFVISISKNEELTSSLWLESNEDLCPHRGTSKLAVKTSPACTT